jgi:predicted nucleic acid-binding protein
VTILVDSPVWISFLNGVNSAETAYLTVCIAEDRPLVVPGLVLTEVLMGARNEAEARRISESLAAFPPVPPPALSDHERAAQIYRTCRSRGHKIRSSIDCLIAQLCLRDGHELLAQDRDFEAIGSVFPLKRPPLRLMAHESTVRYAVKAGAPSVG